MMGIMRRIDVTVCALLIICVIACFNAIGGSYD